ncbi:hypothetical protein [Haladaptatus salinisoli]|uniref:hypothetical protein n=1 Tax=Haladaptatus salinisoli TaxID=2884876 RepID=UPI001D0A009D|nr:hypothetical protein [Haladaptatus salinisoli]
MGTQTGPRTAVVLSFLLLLSGVTPLVGGTAASANGSPQFGQFSPLQYKVSINNVTVRTWALRNVTVQNATVDSVLVRRLRTDGELQRNVTLRNVSVAELEIENGTLKNVTASRIVVRNRSIWNVPGGNLFDPGVKDRVIERHVLANVTVEGAALDRLVVQNLSVQNATMQEAANESVVPPAVTNPDSKPRPDVVIENGTVERSVIRNASVGEWYVGEIDTENSTG